MAKLVKPTLVEKLIVQKRLQAKYPQMFKKGWGKKKAKKPLTTQRHSDISSQLRKAGIDQATIDRMRGRKKQ